MHIEHLALWVADMEGMRNFYTHYFGMHCGEKYVNATKHFASYFLSFEGSTTRLPKSEGCSGEVADFDLVNTPVENFRDGS